MRDQEQAALASNQTKTTAKSEAEIKVCSETTVTEPEAPENGPPTKEVVSPAASDHSDKAEQPALDDPKSEVVKEKTGEVAHSTTESIEMQNNHRDGDIRVCESSARALSGDARPQQEYEQPWDWSKTSSILFAAGEESQTNPTGGDAANALPNNANARHNYVNATVEPIVKCLPDGTEQLTVCQVTLEDDAPNRQSPTHGGARPKERGTPTPAPRTKQARGAAAGNYEEPWDLSCTQNILEEAFLANKFLVSTDDKGGTGGVKDETQQSPKRNGDVSLTSAPQADDTAQPTDSRPQEGYEKPWDWKPHKKVRISRIYMYMYRPTVENRDLRLIAEPLLLFTCKVIINSFLIHLVGLKSRYNICNQHHRGLTQNIWCAICRTSASRKATRNPGTGSRTKKTSVPWASTTNRGIIAPKTSNAI